MAQVTEDAGRVEAGRPRSANTVVATLAFAGIVVSLMQTIIIPLVPELPRLLGASPTDTAWAVTVTLLAGAVATPTMGRLGDLYGKRRLLVVSLTSLVAGSVVCALSTSLAPLIVGRALQGLSGGVIALGISLLRDVVASRRLASATALMSASLGVGGALGLPAAAFLAERVSWQLLFWISAGIGALALAGVSVLVPGSPVRAGGRFDPVGAVGLSIVLACLLLAISQGANWGWGSGRVLALFAVAAVVLLLWLRWESATAHPVVDPRSALRPQVLLTNVASMVFGFAMFATSLVVPQVVQLPVETGYGLGGTMLTVGLVMAPSGLVMMAMAPVSGRLSNAKGPKTTLVTGALVVAAGYGLGTAFLSTTWQLVLVVSVVGAGIGLAYGAMPALIMAAVPRAETAAANSLNTLMRSIGTSVSSAVTGAVLATTTRSFGAAEVPTQWALRLVMVIGAAAALAAVAISVFLPRGTRAAAR